MKATFYGADGQTREIVPANGTDFSLEELQALVGETIDIQALPGAEEILVLNDNGKLDGLMENLAATAVWRKAFPIAQYPVNNDELIVGDVIVCDKSMVK